MATRIRLLKEMSTSGFHFLDPDERHTDDWQRSDERMSGADLPQERNLLLQIQ